MFRVNTNAEKRPKSSFCNALSLFGLGEKVDDQPISSLANLKRKSIIEELVYPVRSIDLERVFERDMAELNLSRFPLLCADRYSHSTLTLLIMKSMRSGIEVCAWLTDIGNLSGVNDKLGHDQGNMYKELCSHVVHQVGLNYFERVFLFQHGGDEILVIGINPHQQHVSREDLVRDYASWIEKVEDMSQTGSLPHPKDDSKSGLSLACSEIALASELFFEGSDIETVFEGATDGAAQMLSIAEQSLKRC